MYGHGKMCSYGVDKPVTFFMETPELADLDIHVQQFQ